MYSHCLFCKAALGTNEAIEHFPVGRRLAFDASKGRLWVVCPRCNRWNLTPIEERWEAIEEAERLYRGQRLRAQTDNIGMARLKEGTELVRIGPALRPEFAAWRYGREFTRRLRRRVTVIGAGAATLGGGALLVGAPVASALAALPPVWMIGFHFLLPMIMLKGQLKATRVVGQDGKPLKVFRADLEHTRLLGDPDDPFRLMLKHSYGRQELTGDVARRAMGALLAGVNGMGASSGRVRDAVSLVADAGSPQLAAATIAAEAARRSGNFDEEWADWQKHPFRWRPQKKFMDLEAGSVLNRGMQNPINRGALNRLPASLRLALEMSLHEDTEQRALEGELAILEAAWREAEEIAAIADNMFAPSLPRRDAD